MAGLKAARLSEDILRELALLIRELKDPRVREHMVSIVRVEMTDDGSFAKVYISAMEGLEIAAQAVAALTRASGRLRGELSNRLHLRKAPELRFLPDDSIEYSARLDKMFQDLRGDDE